MGRPFIANPEVSDAAVITATTESGVFAAENLLDPQPYRVWRSSTVGTQYLILDLGGSTRVRCIWLGYTNLTSDAFWSIRAADTEGALPSAPFIRTYSSFWPDPSISGWSRIHGFHWIPDADTVEFRWWRIQLTDPTNPAGFLEAGRLYVSDGWRPSRGARYGWASRYLDGSRFERNENSNLFVTRHRARREFDLTISGLTEEEVYDDSGALDRDRGASRDVLYVHDPEDRPRLMDWTIYGTMKGLEPIQNMTLGYYERRLRIEEWELP